MSSFKKVLHCADPLLNDTHWRQSIWVPPVQGKQSPTIRLTSQCPQDSPMLISTSSHSPKGFLWMTAYAPLCPGTPSQRSLLYTCWSRSADSLPAQEGRGRSGTRSLRAAESGTPALDLPGLLTSSASLSKCFSFPF